MGNKFVEAERQLQGLTRSYEDGALDADGFAQALAALQIQDEEEQWWQIQGNGKWLRFNGEDWEEAIPPRPVPPPPPRSALLPPPRPRQEVEEHPVLPPRARQEVEEHSVPPPRPRQEVEEHPVLPPRARQEVEKHSVPPSPIVYPAPDEDDSIFRNTGVPPEQIPGLLDTEPPPGAFLIEPEPAFVEARPVAVKVQNAALNRAPQRPRPPGELPASQPPEPTTQPAKTADQRPTPASQPPAPQTPEPSLAPQSSKTDSQVSAATPIAHTPLPEVEQQPAARSESAPEPAQQAVCWKCHKKLASGAKFCKYCGARPGDAPPAPQSPVAEPAPKPVASTCAHCHAALVATAKFCGKCGHPVGVARCPQCQTAAPAGARFCKQCGHKLS